MAWATRADLEARFGSATIAELESGGAGVSNALSDAEDEAGGWISNVVTLPLDPVPAILKRITCVIARYNLWRRNLPADHPVYVAYRDALKELQAIAEGTILLVADPAPEAATTATPATRLSVFTDTTLDKMP